MTKLATALSALMLCSGLGNVYAEVRPLFTISQDVSEDAPLGNYTATIGATTVSRGIRTNAYSIQGAKISIQLTSISTDQEWINISKAGVKNALSTMSRYNHGTITIAGKSYPINAVASTRDGNIYRIYILTAKPFAPMSSFDGNAYGAIALEVPFIVGKDGKGTIYTRLFSKLSYDDELFSGDETPTITALSAVQLKLPSRN